jgi:hypothetical protein
VRTMLRPILLAIPAMAITLAAGGRPAEAALIKRSMLIQACTAKDPSRLNDCAGYITGIADMADGAQQRVCIPQGLSVRLLRTGVTTYLQSHTTSDGPAAPAVLDALRSLYKCNG